MLRTPLLYSDVRVEAQREELVYLAPGPAQSLSCDVIRPRTPILLPGQHRQRLTSGRGSQSNNLCGRPDAQPAANTAGRGDREAVRGMRTRPERGVGELALRVAMEAHSSIEPPADQIAQLRVAELMASGIGPEGHRESQG